MIAGGRIRADPVRATESLYGPDRAERPIEGPGNAVACPFCPGSEHRTGADLTADCGPAWQSRVVQNLYPAVVEPDGRHEVIVELREHDAVWPALPVATLERILRVYAARELAAFADRYAYVAVFKNSGAPAGASLHHPHAQVIALRRLPLSVAGRLERLAASCSTCATLANGSRRIVERSAATVAYVPDGSRTAFEVRIAPVTHAAHFSDALDVIGPVAGVLSRTLKRLAVVLGEELPFNLVVQSAPRDPRAEHLMHWEIEVVPRIENLGGFELGTGGFLVSRLPEDAAAILRAAGGSGGA